MRISVCLSRFAILCTFEQKVVTLNLTQCLSLYISVELLIIFEILSSSVSPSLQQIFSENIQIFVEKKSNNFFKLPFCVSFCLSLCQSPACFTEAEVEVCFFSILSFLFFVSFSFPFCLYLIVTCWLH